MNVMLIEVINIFKGKWCDSQLQCIWNKQTYLQRVGMEWLQITDTYNGIIYQSKCIPITVYLYVQ